MDPRTDYRYWRTHAPDMPAYRALEWAKYAQAQQATLARLGEWQWESGPYGAFVHADLEYDTDASPYTIRVSVGDDDMPTDWGDCEPTDEERDNTTSYYVAVQVLDAEGEETYHDGIGGVDVIDLPGYLQQDWEDAAAYALNDYLLRGAEDFVRNEDSERADAACRDIETV